jgi:catechol 2,3-dioxygenase-like lactoylglutathione lyase family enzyme
MPKSIISHVAIGVSDMERALSFYRDVLGLNCISDVMEDVNEEGIAPYRRRAAFLTWPGEQHGGFIVLDTQGQRSRGAAPLTFHDIGVHHFSLWVDDLDTIYARAVKAGCKVLLTPRELPANPALGPVGGGTPVKTAFIYDPDENVIQIDQAVG